MSLATLKKKSAAKYNNNSVGLGFALNGTHRNQGYVGQTSLSRTVISSKMSGNALKGHGGCCGSYPTRVIKTQQTDKCLEDSSVVKDSTLGTRGMIREKYKWIWRGGEHAPAKSGDSNNFNYSSYRTSKFKTDTLALFETEENCKILPGVVYPAPRSVRVDEMTTRIVYNANPAYGINLTSYETKYGFDFRDPENNVTNSLKNKMTLNGDMVVGGGSLTASPSGLEFADSTFNLDTIYVDKSNVAFGNTSTLVLRFKINTFDSGAPGQVWRSIMHYSGPIASDSNKEVFSIKYLRANGTAAPHAGKSQGQLFVQWGVWNANTFHGNYYHSTGTVSTDEYVTLMFEFEKGTDDTNPSGVIKLKNAFTGNNINDSTKNIAWTSAENIQLNSTITMDSGVWVASAVDDTFNPTKIIVGSNLDETPSPVGDNDANEEASGAITVSHLYVFNKALTDAERSTFVSKVIVQPESYPSEDVSLDQNNILVRRAGTDQIWTQNREDYNHIDQSQYINRLKAKCTLEDSMLTTRNTKGTPFIGFN